jgi:hypothetical protein
LNEPEIYKDIQWIWEAFLMLSGGRNFGFGGPLAVSLQETLAYCEIYGIQQEEERQEFVFTIRMLDSEWLNDHYKRAKANKGAK